MPKLLISAPTKRLIEAIAAIIEARLARNASEVARRLGVSPAMITEVRGKRSNAGEQMLQNTVKEFGVSREWLFFGEGQMFAPAAPLILRNGTTPASLKGKKAGVPVYDTDFTAGDVTLFQDDQERVIGHVDLEGFRNCVGFVRVRGSSMYPDFVAGDFIGLEPDTDLDIIEYGQPYAIVTKTDKRMLKIIRKGKDDDHLILKSVNREFDDINLHKSKIQKLFKVHGPVRDQWQ